MTTPDPSFSEIIRVRLLARISIAGLSLSALSKQMNRAHSYLGRKLQPSEDGERRELSTTEVDEILRELKLAPEALFVPAFGPGDTAFLKWIAETAPEDRTRTQAGHVFAGVAKAVDRLATQGLVVEDAEGFLSVTDAGSQWAAA